MQKKYIVENDLDPRINPNDIFINDEFTIDSNGYFISDNLTIDQEIHNLNIDNQINQGGKNE